MNDIPLGKAGSRERVNFGQIIGDSVDQDTGMLTPTTNGIIHYRKNDKAHIVPAHP